MAFYRVDVRLIFSNLAEIGVCLILSTVNARISAWGTYLIFLARGGANSKGGHLFRLSIFGLKMTPSLFLFETKLQHKISKTL